MANFNSLVCSAVLILYFVSIVACEVHDNESNVEARTFGHHFLKRISFAIIPAAFVVGMITTLLGALTIVSVKSLGVGIVLLVLTVGQLIAKNLPQAVPITAYTTAPAAPIHCACDCAIRKSWKAEPNFDENIPKFTPFENMETELKDVKEDVKEIKTTEAITQPSPSAETLKISSKFKMSEKIAKAFINEIKDDDFGKFAYEVPETSSEEDESNEVNEDEDDIEFPSFEVNENTTEFKYGQMMNVTLNPEEDTVNVKLDQRSMKEIFTGRGKKYGILERIVPLFILPFLIQSAFVPFVVTSIKLLLMKSLFAGKIAILFLLLGALKNHQTSMYMKSFATQHAPFLNRDYPIPFLPERRIESNFDGYKVDGKPEAFVN